MHPASSTLPWQVGGCLQPESPQGGTAVPAKVVWAGLRVQAVQVVRGAPCRLGVAAT
jgi:hypothetical protein